MEIKKLGIGRTPRAQIRLSPLGGRTPQSSSVTEEEPCTSGCFIELDETILDTYFGPCFDDRRTVELKLSNLEQQDFIVVEGHDQQASQDLLGANMKEVRIVGPDQLKLVYQVKDRDGDINGNPLRLTIKLPHKKIDDLFTVPFSFATSTISPFDAVISRELAPQADGGER